MQQLVFTPSKSETFCALSAVACLIARHVLVSIFLDFIQRLLEHCALSLSDCFFTGDFPLQMQVTTDIYVGGSMQILQNILYTEIIDFETPFSIAAVLAPLVARSGSSVSTSSYYLTEKNFMDPIVLTSCTFYVFSICLTEPIHIVGVLRVGNFSK